MTDLRWAPPTREDDPEWAELLAAIEAVDQRGEVFELDDLADEWASVWSKPDTNARFVWDGPELVGFVWLGVRPGQREAHKVSQWGGVRPSRRGEGIGSALFDWAVRRTADLAADLDPGLAVHLQIDASEHQAALVAVASRAGYQPVRRFLEIARPVGDAVPDLPSPAGLELVPWCPELDEGARLAHVESFADHWGSEPRTREEWNQWYTGHRAFRSELSVLAVDAATEEVVSLVLCAAYPQDWVQTPVEAWVNTVGTRRAWRGKGVARWVLAESLRRVAAADDGFERAILGVDAENPTGALRLYRDLGFVDEVRSVTTLRATPVS